MLGCLAWNIPDLLAVQLESVWWYSFWFRDGSDKGWVELFVTFRRRSCEVTGGMSKKNDLEGYCVLVTDISRYHWHLLTKGNRTKMPSSGMIDCITFCGLQWAPTTGGFCEKSYLQILSNLMPQYIKVLPEKSEKGFKTDSCDTILSSFKEKL